MNRMNVDADLVAGGSKSFLGGGKGLAGSSKGPAASSKKRFSTSAGGGGATEHGLWRPVAAMPTAHHLARMGRVATRLFRKV